MPVATQKIAKTELWDIGKLSLWSQNPRGIKEDRYRELKARLQRQGQIKPLLVTKTGTVIGGNMRLRAMKDLGWDQALVAIQEAETDREIFDLALTDNEEFGYYEAEAVVELAQKVGIDEDWIKTYAIHLDDPKPLDLVIAQLGPGNEPELTNEGREQTCRQCPFHCDDGES